MPLPRISGLLNNCALNTALPTLLEGIRVLAEREAAGTLNLGDNPILQSYEQLKHFFALHYGVDRNPAFNWQQFHAFLMRYGDNFYAKEILFAPVLRSFIAKVAADNGADDENISILRDIQADGRYNYLDDRTAVELLHHRFGISIETSEFSPEASAALGADSTDHSRRYTFLNRLNAPIVIYPFDGGAPRLHFYLKDAHFELQPHESLGEANTNFGREVNALPLELVAIHEGISCGDSFESSTTCLARLLIHGRGSLIAHLAATAPAVSAPTSGLELDGSLADLSNPADGVLLSIAAGVGDASSRGGDGHDEGEAAAILRVAPSEVAVDQSTSGKPDLKKGYTIAQQRDYVRAADYALSGVALHSDTSSGRYAFASILLTLLKDESNPQVEELLGHMHYLSQHSIAPLASLLLDNLTRAIIRSQANLNAKTVTAAIQEIENYRDTVGYLGRLQSVVPTDVNNKRKRAFALAASQVIQAAWEQYQETDDPDLIQVIQATYRLVRTPTNENLQPYSDLQAKIQRKSGWGPVVFGLMWAVIGAACIAFGIGVAIASFGTATPLSALIVGAGGASLVVGAGSLMTAVGFFNTPPEGLHVDMRDFSSEAEFQRPKPVMVR